MGFDFFQLHRYYHLFFSDRYCDADCDLFGAFITLLFLDKANIPRTKVAANEWIHLNSGSIGCNLIIYGRWAVNTPQPAIKI